MDIDAILSELGTQMGLPNLKLDDNKVCRLIFDKKYTVDIEASEDLKVVHIYSALCTIPPSDREKFYESLLEANLFGRGTGGAAFGVDLEMGEILISRTIEMEDIVYQKFVNVLESFVNHIEAWTEKIESGSIMHDKGPSHDAPKKESPTRKPGDDGPPPPDAPPPGYIMA